MKRVALLLAGLGLLAGCSSGQGSAGSASDSGLTSDEMATAGQAATGGGVAAAPAGPAVMRRRVVSTGSVSIAARDLSQPTRRVDAVVSGHHGTVADERSTADLRGRPTRTRLVVRVPSTEFAAAMHDLAAVPGVVRSDRSSDDVTTQVIDVAQRVKAQRIGLDRVDGLLSRAGSLTEVLALEKEITSRQAELNSLLQQQAYLTDQTSLSTITITLARSATPPVRHDGRPAGFWSGLGHGWHAFGLFLSGALTGVGAALPFALAAAVVGVPVWLVVRRRRTRPVVSPTTR